MELFLLDGDPSDAIRTGRCTVDWLMFSKSEIFSLRGDVLILSCSFENKGGGVFGLADHLLLGESADMVTLDRAGDWLFVFGARYDETEIVVSTFIDILLASVELIFVPLDCAGEPIGLSCEPTDLPKSFLRSDTLLSRLRSCPETGMWRSPLEPS